MDVEGVRRWFAGQQAHALHKLFLEIIGQIVLGTKEDHAALRD